jgi:hypothetical protein
MKRATWFVSLIFVGTLAQGATNPFPLAPAWLGPPVDCLTPPNAQWADSVLEFSSEYGRPEYSADQVLGPCDTSAYADSSTAWAAKEPDLPSGEFLSVGFKTPVHAIGAVIRETFGNGFVTRVETINTENGYSIVWEGTDKSATGEPADFEVSWGPRRELVKGLRITLDPARHQGWDEIDSVQLIAAP